MKIMLSKALVLAVICLFIGTSILPSISGDNSGLNESKYHHKLKSSELLDELDQYNHKLGLAHLIYFNGTNDFWWIAQSFKPTLPTLTRVNLRVYQSTYPQPLMTCDLIVSIREDLNGTDLVSISKNPNLINCSGPDDWVEFDFQDISVTPENTYYIVAKCQCGNVSNTYLTIWCNWAEYTRGAFWRKNSEGWSRSAVNPGQGWGHDDIPFETYGSHAEIPSLEIESIAGGFRVSAVIKNNGTGTAIDVNWSIDLESGLILVGDHSEGVISELAPGATTTIRQSTLYGIGRTTITVTAGTTSKQATAFILGPLVLGVEEIS